MSRPSVVIIGGGISGLCAAYELSGGADGTPSDGRHIEVLEAGPRFGGSLATTTFAGRTIDLGADGFLSRRPEALALARDLGLGDTIEAVAASGASLFLNGTLDRLPDGMVLGVPTSAKSLKGLRGLSRSARFQAWRDEHWPRSYTPAGDVSIGEILRAKLGGTLAYEVIEPMIGGIQAGRIDELSATAVFPGLMEAARRKGSLMKNIKATAAATAVSAATRPSEVPVFSSLTGGVGSLVDALVTTLRQRGVTLRTNAAATLVKRTPTGSYPWQVDTTTTTSEADVVILATPASVTAALIGAHHDALQRLAAITNVATAMVTMSFPKDDLRLPPHGTGVLVPLGSPFGDDFYLTTALTFLDRKWPHLRRDDDVLVRVHVGRSDDRRFAALDDATLVDRVVAELRQILSTSATPLDSLVQRWPAGLPQYYVGHDVVVANAKKAAAELGVVLVGNAYDGVGIPASIGIGRRGGQAAADLLTR